MMTLKRLVFISILLAILVVSLGAYTRLTHAGLGCPDWPGCYGFLDVPDTEEQLAHAQNAFPEHTIEPHKAWNEMIHRYFAGTLGLLVLAISIICIQGRKDGLPLKLPIMILAVVVFQAALGMWTVTMKLMPIVVMGHLLGGFTTLALLFILYLRVNTALAVTPVVEGEQRETKKLMKFKLPAIVGIVILTLQIALGGWTSSNYAALVCTELPICQDGWQAQLSFKNSFDFIPPEKATYEFGHLDHHERVTIHVVHRIGAIVTAGYLLWLAFCLYKFSRNRRIQKAALVLVAILCLQVGLGVSNIVFSLPLFIAVSHNVVAACLMLALLFISYQVFIITQHKGAKYE